MQPDYSFSLPVLTYFSTPIRFLTRPQLLCRIYALPVGKRIFLIRPTMTTFVAVHQPQLKGETS